MIDGALGRVVRRLRRVDPCGPLLALVALALFLARGFQGGLSRDLALYAYGAQQTADGIPPYVAVLTRAGPLGQLVPGVGAWGARVVGVDELLGMRLVMMVVSVATVWVLYCLGRDLLASRGAGLVAGACLLAFNGFAVYATGGPREKTTMLLFLVCCLWAVTRRRWGWAGVSLALATLSWQPVFIVGVAAVVVAIAFLRGGRTVLQALVRFAVGGAIPTALCVVGFALVGALDEFLEGFALVNSGYTQQSSFFVFVRLTGLSQLDEGFGATLWLLAGGALAMVVAAVLRLRTALRGREPEDAAVVAVGAATLAGLGWSLRAFNGWPDAMVLLPMAALGLGYLARTVLERVPAPAGRVLVGALTALLLVFAAVSAVQGRSHLLEVQRKGTARILDAAPPGASIWSVDAPQALVLSDGTNPSRYQMFGNGLDEYTDDAHPGGLAGLVTEIEKTQPTFITVHRPRKVPWLRATLVSDYRFVARAPGWLWYARRDLTDAELQRIRRAGRGFSDEPGAPELDD